MSYSAYSKDYIIVGLKCARPNALMRLFITTFIALLGLAVSGFASVNFNGTWVLDLKASDSPEPMMKRMGVSGLERKLAASTKLEST